MHITKKQAEILARHSVTTFAPFALDKLGMEYAAEYLRNLPDATSIQELSALSYNILGAARSYKGLSGSWESRAPIVRAVAIATQAVQEANRIRYYDLELYDFEVCEFTALAAALVAAYVPIDGQLWLATLNDADIDIPEHDISDLDIRVYKATIRPGALVMDKWHSCATTHCRAGWAELLVFGTQEHSAFWGVTAYALAYPDRELPNFFEDEDGALLDIKRLAEC